MNFDQIEEAELIDLVKNGDRHAWEYITKEYYQAILNFINNMVHDWETAEELVQDIFVNFWTKRENLNINLSLKAYLYRASRNHTLNFIKRRNFERDYQKGVAERMEISKNDTEDAYHFNELEKKLYASIEELPEKMREIFKMSRFEDLTYKEIAEALDIPVRTVHYQIGLALKQLREKLKGHADPSLMSYSGWVAAGLVTQILMDAEIFSEIFVNT
ncbi:RNA polymerase sigma-70 factor [Flammeovirga yaeyamensis]|uniref:RNA polymerase sigma-70 factor n=1 Tax=Flammeovirga yaeyamensis TaxID=367791 RepID=A0AAX1N4X3_9BACT|nr:MULTISPECIES: RNA polymerase sigma-70 factor [Flammeovirga]ANQ49935.1 RNA polymerase sigma-70 factor [Flammeovirga sp. MY04]MBB3701325.1 RNA polymerase sigma-70 factor (ECF subfamily) [Flammeovirga yaeyamensis]NMF38206.1 RNA polymerase sigma-70 factor [Flammeovirga yaeyamensis]QWG02619.1 RNA polymerase sigma-70 factor [Flammeovirga yaeyamensis]